MTTEPVTYAFGARPKSGIIFGLSGRHLAVAGTAGAFVLGLLMAGQIVPAIVIILATIGLVGWPVRQERLLDWLWVRIGLLRRLLVGSARRDDPTPVAGWVDASAGGRTWGVRTIGQSQGEVWLRVSGAPEFVLRSAEHQDQLLAEWGAWLASLAREGSPIQNATWLEVAAPSASGGPEAWMASHAQPRTDEALADYASLLDSLTSTSTEHEVYLRVQLQPRTTRTDLATATATAASQLRATIRPVSVEPMSAADVARLVEALVVPGAALAAGARRAMGGGAADPQPIPPLLECGDHVRIGSQRAQVWWAAELPRTPLRAFGLSQLFASAVPCVRLIWTELAPVSEWTAKRRAQGARTALVSTRHGKLAKGNIPTFDEEQELADLEARASELLAGHAMLQHSTFAAVIAPTSAILDEAAATVESAAGTCGLMLRRLGPRQRAALGALIPEVLP